MAARNKVDLCQEKGCQNSIGEEQNILTPPTITCTPSQLKVMITVYIYIIVEKSPNSSHMYDHGFMDNTNRQAVKN